ncbi:hypothetical protein HPB51_025915 [Rhipicephalus microplus]|uniref:Uncharacterized protein n=1 Tax=Rhipicephalus microplus TaxID=6941 RepID=A0A9J6EDI8_RHIMP|nr:hypothetical protein HPB51_025915 [Rhipicephalus microplus]
MPVGAYSSPFLLAATLQHHIEDWKKTELVIYARLQNAFYVNNLVMRASTDEEAFEIYLAALTILADAGIELGKWRSNSSLLCRQFLKDNNSIDNIGEAKERTKLLGLVWNHSDDNIKISPNAVSAYLSAHSATKRTILQSFPRLGLIAPLAIRAKLLFQQLWRLNSP